MKLIRVTELVHCPPYPQETVKAQLLVNNCSFDRMAFTSEDAYGAVFYDVFKSANTSMQSVIVSDSIGWFYESHHSLTSELAFSHIVVETGALTEGTEEEGIFEFQPFDVITVNDLTVDFSYDMDACEWKDELGDHAAVFECTNPVKLLLNYGDITMHDVEVNVHLDNVIQTGNGGGYSTFWFYAAAVLDADIYEYFDYSFINNLGTMDIVNLSMTGSLAYSCILNEGTLSLTDSSFKLLANEINDSTVNMLHSHALVEQSGSAWASLTISNTHFVGSHYGVLVSGGTLDISDSVFEANTFPIDAEEVESVVIEECEFTNIGLYSGPCPDDDDDPSGLRITDSEWVDILDSNFTGFSPEGFVIISTSKNVTLRGNEFTITVDDLFYGDVYYPHFIDDQMAVAIKWSQDITFTENVMTENYHPSSAWNAWVNFKLDSGTTCLSGNQLRNI